MCRANDIKRRAKQVPVGLHPHDAKAVLLSNIRFPQSKEQKDQGKPVLERKISDDTATTAPSHASHTDDVEELFGYETLPFEQLASQNWVEEKWDRMSFGMLPEGGIISVPRESHHVELEASPRSPKRIHLEPRMLPIPSPKDDLSRELEDLSFIPKCATTPPPSPFRGGAQTPSPIHYDALDCPPSPHPPRKIVVANLARIENLCMPFLK